MTEALAWIATTPEGEELGRLAAQQVQLVYQPLPWWSFPLLPWHWLMALSSTLPHQFHSVALYTSLALGLGLWLARRRGWRAGLAWFATLCLLLVGGLPAHNYVFTRLPHGYTWRLAAGAPLQLANLHSHTQASGGMLMPEELVSWHQQHGYQIVGITDSNKTYAQARAQAAAQGFQPPLIVVPGEEYRGTTHLLLLGLRQPIRADQVVIATAIAQARQAGAVVIGAHTWTGRHTPEQLLEWGVQGFEVSNGRALAGPELIGLCQQRHLAPLGTLDFRGGRFPRTATVFSQQVDSPEKVLQALRLGHCAALYRPSWVEPAHFDFRRSWLNKWEELKQSSLTWLGPGVVLWILAGLGLKRLRGMPIKARRAWPLILVLCLITAALGLAAFWWRFKSAWFPRVEWALLAWALSCPLCLYLAAAESSTQQAGHLP